MHVITLDTIDLGDRSYVVTDGAVAAVFDPQRDIDRLLAVVEAQGLEITHVFETHLHNDYVTGGLELAEQTGAAYCVAAADDVAFDRVAVTPGQRFEVGELSVEAIATPGHTINHLSYAIRHGDDVAVCTGGSMLYGAVGRTDLLGEHLAEGLAHDQYHSVRGLAADLPGLTDVLPTHGFGSFCSSNRNQDLASATIDDEKGRNPALVTDDEEAFVRTLLASYTAYPTYYAHMGPVNAQGALPADLSEPASVYGDDLDDRLASGEWVLDLRPRQSFAAGHRAGTVNFEAGRFFATYVGWIVPFDAPVTLVGAGDAQIAEARRALARIGYDAVTGKAVGPAALGSGRPSAYGIGDFARLAERRASDGFTVLDVRRDDEWADGHIEGVVHIHLAELPERIDEVPEGEVWVHCASGFRAAIAASLVERAGRSVVLVDDEFERAADAGLPIVTS